MNVVIMFMLLAPTFLGAYYMWTHPMPSFDLSTLEQQLSGNAPEKKPIATIRKHDDKIWFKRAPVAGDAGIPEGRHIMIKTDAGKILIELFPNEAPDTVANFKALTGKGFYDGLTFFRIAPDFAALTGDPKGNGKGGPGYRIKDELNRHKNVNGAVVMMLPDGPDSAGSQFFICFGNHPRLDGQNTVFGQVIEGMDVVGGLIAGTVMRKVSVLP